MASFGALATFRRLERIRFRPKAALQHGAKAWCQLLSEQSRRAGRLDVRFTPQVVIWGAAAEDFEEIRDIPERTMQ